MVQNNSKFSLRVKLVWIGVGLTILFFVLQQCNVLDWSLWQTFLPLIAALIVYAWPYLVRAIYIKIQKSALKAKCKKMVRFIQATNESTVKENLMACLEIANEIEAGREGFKRIPSDNFVKSVMKPVSFLFKNKEFMEKLEKLAESQWTEDQRNDAITLLKDQEEVYSNLWF